jgi:tetratricopeptide (TPR) repeat protein
MRKSVLSVLLVYACTFCFAQDKFFASESQHYKVFSQTSQAQADEVARTMEACLALYNGVFHFDLSKLPGKLQVKVFADASGFKNYLNDLTSQPMTDFVFLSYEDPQKSELLAFTKEPDAFLSSLIHQGCVQFIKAFVANPPMWLREGVAIYLEGSSYDPKTSALVFKPNFIWLDTLKAILRGENAHQAIPISDLIGFTKETAQEKLDVFYPEAWGLVSFLMASPDKSINRILWDSIGSMAPKASIDDNSQRAQRTAFSWVDSQALQKAFQSYALSLKTVQDLVREGVDFYVKGDLDQAERSFRSSLDLQPDSNISYYYLGLISYSRKDYAGAEKAYVKAGQLGMAGAAVDYALGVNAFAGGNLTEATDRLTKAKESDPAYAEKVDGLLKRIKALKK